MGVHENHENHDSEMDDGEEHKKEGHLFFGENYKNNPIFDQNGEKLFLVKPFEPPPNSKVLKSENNCFEI